MQSPSAMITPIAICRFGWSLKLTVKSRLYMKPWLLTLCQICSFSPNMNPKLQSADNGVRWSNCCERANIRSFMSSTLKLVVAVAQFGELTLHIASIKLQKRLTISSFHFVIYRRNHNLFQLYLAWWVVIFVTSLFPANNKLQLPRDDLCGRSDEKPLTIVQGGKEEGNVF